MASGQLVQTLDKVSNELLNCGLCKGTRASLVASPLRAQLVQCAANTSLFNLKFVLQQILN